jgi:hypothetical protein
MGFVSKPDDKAQHYPPQFCLSNTKETFYGCRCESRILKWVILKGKLETKTAPDCLKETSVKIKDETDGAQTQTLNGRF